jgi:hypothetical protein
VLLGQSYMPTVPQWVHVPLLPTYSLAQRRPIMGPHAAPLGQLIGRSPPVYMPLTRHEKRSCDNSYLRYHIGPAPPLSLNVRRISIMHFMMVRYADLPKGVDLPPDSLTVRLITSDQNTHPMEWNWVGNRSGLILPSGANLDWAAIPDDQSASFRQFAHRWAVCPVDQERLPLTPLTESVAPIR